MNQTTDCAQVRINLGVYVLGAIDPTERAMVDAHLTTCRDCRDELAGLAGIPALLSRITGEEVLQLGEAGTDGPAGHASGQAPSEDLLGSVLDLAAARRRRRLLRTGLLTAAAAVIIAAGAFTGTHLLTTHTTHQPPVAVGSDPHSFGGALGPWETAAGSNSSGEAGWVSYRPMGWGVQLDARVVGIPVGTTCQLYVVTRDGRHHLAGQWSTDSYENNVWYPASASVPAGDVASFEVTTGGRTPPVIIPVR